MQTRHPISRHPRAKAARQDESHTGGILAAMGILAAAALAWAIFLSPALAEDAAGPVSGTYTIDESHVHTTFVVSHLGFSETYGNFDKVSGTITVDAADPAASAVNVTIDTASIDSAWEARDEHLRGDDFFKVAEFPEMTFVSTSVDPTGDTTATVTGDLTLLGKTHPVTLDVTLNQAGKHPFSGKTLVGFSATGSLDRTMWGMDYGVPAVGKDIKLLISAEAVLDE